MQKWRDELKRMMDQAGYRRVPVLRRSSGDCFLFATDFPQAAEEDAVTAFLDFADKAGWHTERENGWIFLERPPVFEAAENIPAAGTEAACCLSILKRYTGSVTRSDGSAERALLKAAEEGETAYENACSRIHTAWAAALRNHTGIPGVDSRFFGEEAIR